MKPERYCHKCDIEFLGVYCPECNMDYTWDVEELS